MADIARLVASLELQSAQFQRELEKANKRLSKFDKDVRGAAGRIKTAFAGAFTGLAVGAGFRAILNATEGQQKATAQLEAALKSTGNAVGLTSNQLQNLAGELQRTTTFADETVLSAEALLLTFTKVGGETFPRAIKAAADLSTALGKDLQSATTLVGKALNDPIKGLTNLSRVGVTFTAEQTKVIKALVDTGKAAEAQNLILAELEKRFGGSAAAATTTFGGAITQLKNAFGDLLEGDGLGGATEGVKSLTASLNDPAVKQGFATITQGVFTTIGALAQLIAGLVNAGTAVKNFFSDNTLGELESRLASLEKRRAILARQGLGRAVRGVDEDIAGTKARIADLSPGIQLTDTAAARVQSQIQQNTGLLNSFINLQTVSEEALKKNQKAIEDQARAAESARENLAGLAQSAQQHAETFGLSETAIAQYRVTVGDLADDVKLAGDAGLRSAEAYVQWTAQIEEATRAQKELEEEQSRLREESEAHAALLDRVRPLITNVSDETQEYADNVRALDEALAGQAISQAQYNVGIEKAGKEFEEASGKAKKAFNAAEEFSREAARGIQSAFADFFFDPFDEGLKGLFDNFKRTLDRIAAEIVAAQLSKALFGGGEAGGGGGLFGKIGAVLGGVFGGAKAFGGPVTAGTGYLVGEKGPEFFVPNTNGQIIPNDKMGGVVVNVYNQISAPNGNVSRQSLTQLETATGLSVRRALARNS